MSPTKLMKWNQHAPACTDMHKHAAAATHGVAAA